MASYAAYRAGYLALWNGCEVTAAARPEAEREARAIIAGKARLQALQKATTVPWFVIGALLVREAGLVKGGLPWGAYLGNGEHIIGTGRRSSKVPPNRGPFATFEDGAKDALHKDALDTFNWTGADGPARVAYKTEAFNGFGYRSKGEPSPYLWGGTNRQKRGKFVADHRFSAGAWDPQIGVMATLKCVMELDPDARFGAAPGIPLPPVVIGVGTITAGAGGLLFDITPTTAGVTGFVLGALVVAAVNIYRNPEGVKAMLGTNWKTSSTGLLGIIGGAGAILTAIGTKNWSPEVYIAGFAAIMNGITGLNAQDNNVTGGTVRQ